jgi:hypothetical protein
MLNRNLLFSTKHPPLVPASPRLVSNHPAASNPLKLNHSKVLGHWLASDGTARHLHPPMFRSLTLLRRRRRSSLKSSSCGST